MASCNFACALGVTISVSFSRLGFSSASRTACSPNNHKVAFASVFLQAPGLYGPNGLEPVEKIVARVANNPSGMRADTHCYQYYALVSACTILIPFTCVQRSFGAFDRKPLSRNSGSTS